MIDRIQQRILQTAMQVPEYVGYQAKDRRREEDKLVRRQLAAKYAEQQTRLNRVARRSPLEYITELENLDQKLQRLVARLSTAPTGYAGWFDAAQIAEGDLDQLTSFDATLAGGAGDLAQAIDAIQTAVQGRAAVSGAVDSTADLLDQLNSRFDQREQFLAMGKAPTPIEKVAAIASPLDALKRKESLSTEIQVLSTLKLKDAVSFNSVDYVVTGKITFAAQGDTFWAYLLQDTGNETWLHVGPSAETGIYHPVAFDAISPAPDVIEFEGSKFARAYAGTAMATIEGVGGRRSGQVAVALFATPDGSRLWTERYPSDSRAMMGHIVDPSELRVYRR